MSYLIPVNLQYMVANFKVYSLSHVLALLFKLFQLKLAYHIQDFVKYTRIAINHAPSKRTLIYLDIRDSCMHAYYNVLCIPGPLGS